MSHTPNDRVLCTAQDGAADQIAAAIIDEAAERFELNDSAWPWQTKRTARGQVAQGFTVAGADADPVFRCSFEEVEIPGHDDLRQAHQGPALAEVDGIRFQGT